MKVHFFHLMPYRFLPDDYVSDNQQRFEMYKRLAELSDPEGVDDLRDEMTDRFGTPPPEALRLLSLGRARVWARRSRVARAVAERNLWTLVFAPQAQIGRRQIDEWRAVLGDQVTFTSGPPFQITVRAPLGASACEPERRDRRLGPLRPGTVADSSAERL